MRQALSFCVGSAVLMGTLVPGVGAATLSSGQTKLKDGGAEQRVVVFEGFYNYG